MDKKTSLLFLIPLLPLVGAFLNLCVWRLLFPTTGRLRQPDRLTHTTAILAVLGAFGVSCYLVGGPLLQEFLAWEKLGEAKTETMGGLTQLAWTWIEVGSLKIDLAFRLDTLSAVMILIITGIGSLIHIYSVGYMHGEKRYPAFFGYLNLFMGAMLILVLGDNLPVMFIGWEGVGLCSYLLIGFWFEKTENANAGRKAFIVNRVGDFAFILGMCLLFFATESVNFRDMQSPESIIAFKQEFLGGERLAMVAGLLLFIGACGKSAQIPLYVWLPDAMAGPTPVSALIHAATMVTAGVYMIARMSFLFAHSTTAMAVVAGVGALTALFAAIMAFAQTDLKKVLAYSTVSQLGFMFVGVGLGAYVAGIFHLLTHAFFKAGLFLAAGSVMHAMSGSGDITKMGGLRKLLPWTHLSFIVYCLAISGIFPFAGFFSKDELLAGAFGANAEGWASTYGEVLWIVLSVAALGTAFYMFRLYFLVFGGENRSDAETRSHIHESPLSMTGPLLILAFFTTVVGFLGMPHVSILGWHPQNYLHRWLDAALVSFERASLAGSVEAAHFGASALWILMGVATLVAAVGIGAAYLVYGQGPSKKVDQMCSGGLGARVHKVVFNKFYVDEFYEATVLRGFRWIANVLYEVVDRFLIDFIIVNGSAYVVDVFGRIARTVQNGQVQRYLVAMVIGAALIFYFATSPTVAFKYVQTSASIVDFTPDIGAGMDAKGASVDFDFDGDGVSDAQQNFDPTAPGVVKWAFKGPGSYKVTMTMKDAVFGKTYKSTQTVVVKEDSRIHVPTPTLESNRGAKRRFDGLNEGDGPIRVRPQGER